MNETSSIEPPDTAGRSGGAYLGLEPQPRSYQSWVADETMEDYALRFTPRSFRKWSELRIANTALTEVFSPLPTTQLHNSLAVQTGLKAQAAGGMLTALAGDRNTIQTIVELTDPKDYDAARSRLLDESRHPSAKYQIFLVGRSTPEIDELTAEIFRCREIANKYRNEPDQEVKEYCNGQLDRANRLTAELERLTRRSLLKGSGVLMGTLAAGSTLALLAPSTAWALELKQLSQVEGNTLLQMGRVLFPHAKLPDAVYALLAKDLDGRAAADPEKLPV